MGVRLAVADKRECRYIFTAFWNLGELILKVANVELEAITLPHLTTRRRWLFFFGFPAGGVLSEVCLSYLLETVERVQRQGVEPIRGRPFQAGRKG